MSDNTTPESRGLAAQCWCDPRTSGTVMDPTLAEVFAEMLDRHNETALQYFRNQQFYRGLVVQIGEMFGDAAKTCDDGSVVDEVLVKKVPELVARAVSENASRAESCKIFRKAIIGIQQLLTQHLQPDGRDATDTITDILDITDREPFITMKDLL